MRRTYQLDKPGSFQFTSCFSFSSPVLQDQPCPSHWGPDLGPRRPSPSPGPREAALTPVPLSWPGWAWLRGKTEPRGRGESVPSAASSALATPNPLELLTILKEFPKPVTRAIGPSSPGPAVASTSYLLPEGLLLHSHKALFIPVSWPPSFWDGREGGEAEEVSDGRMECHGVWGHISGSDMVGGVHHDSGRCLLQRESITVHIL